MLYCMPERLRQEPVYPKAVGLVNGGKATGNRARQTRNRRSRFAVHAKARSREDGMAACDSLHVSYFESGTSRLRVIWNPVRAATTPIDRERASRV